MAVVGSKADNKPFLRGYEQDPMHGTASAYMDVVQSAKQEAGIGLFETPMDFFRNSTTSNEMKKYFVENSYDPQDPKFVDHPAAVEDHLDNMSALFENDVSGILTEATNLGAYSPVIGMTLPIHKNILMNAVFDSVMPKDVARSPKFTLTMETRSLVDINGNEIDMYAEQNKIYPSIENSVPSLDVVVNLPEQEATDFISLIGTANKTTYDPTITNLSMRTEVLGILVRGVYVKAGDLVWNDTTQKEEVVDPANVGNPQVVLFKLHANFTPGYGEDNRQMHKKFAIDFAGTAQAAANPEQFPNEIMHAVGIMTGYITEKNKVYLTLGPLKYIDRTTGAETFGNGNYSVEQAIIHAVLDVSTAAFPTVKVKWSAKTTFYEIPESPHITVPITPEEVKDIQALYDINQVTKLMSMVRLSLMHWKDDSIHANLDESYRALPDNVKVAWAFDWAPPLNFTGTPKTWRYEMFMDNLDMYVTRMLNVLNDENMTVTIFGRPEIIRRMAPSTYSYQTPSNIGPVELDFTRTVVTSEKRVYNFVSSQKLRNNNNLIVLLIPRNSMRITYKVIDYQMYLSNEIRDTKQYQLPSMTAFERWKFLEYQPVQGRVKIVNVSGLRENLKNLDPIGENAMNDYTANTEQYASMVNGVVDPATGSFPIPPIK